MTAQVADISSQPDRRRLPSRKVVPLPLGGLAAPDETIYMPAHIKFQQGGTPCPRVHFHDDAGSTTGKIYIGYVGDQLPTAGFS